ncbi:MAG: TVP38/TMEM64 family protein [Pirellulales bacterium]
MRELIRPAAIIALALCAPLVPLLFFGDSLDARVAGWLDSGLSPLTVWSLVVGVLASDVLLPVPSSAVSTFGGAQLGLLQGTLASWIGMTLGAMGGFALARWLGRPLARRLAKAEDLQRLEGLGQRHGPRMLVMLRAVPLLAEASVLLLGTIRIPWRRFLWPVSLSNLGIAAAYSAFGRFAAEYNALPAALIASIALPLAVTTIVRRFLPPAADSSSHSTE